MAAAILVEDQAGWHRSEKVEVPVGIEREHLPPYSPELQPAERLWLLVDEPLVNEHFKSIEEIEEILIKRCQVLIETSLIFGTLTQNFLQTRS